MRNLKRALSLALASVMVLSMMLVGAGAVSIDDFSDSESVVNKEAVTVLATLGVITGNDDGSYNPTGIITRAEMTTIICRILNGGRDPQLGSTVIDTYTDTSSHWAKAYIEYCTTMGIVSGRGDGTFDPNGTVTVAEAAKMLLVALGYNAGVEGYVGASWQVNTDVQANLLDLYDGLGTLNTNADLTRDNAAQMCYNALDADMVEYNYVITGTADNSLTTRPQANSNNLGTLLEERFNAVKVEGVVVGNEFATLSATADHGSALDTNRTRIQITNAEDQDAYTGTRDFATTTGKDELGRAVSLYVKVETNSTRALVLGSVILSEDNKVVTDYTADSINDVADDNNMDIVSGTRVANNYASLSTLGSSAAAADGTAGVEKILIDNDGDNEVDVVLLNTYTFGKVTSYVSSGDGNITVSAGSTNAFTADDADDVVGFEDVARNNYVLAAWIGGKLHVTLAETVTGNLEEYRQSSGNTTRLTVDGTEYRVSHIPGYTGGTDNISAAMAYGSENLDNEATFYLGAGEYVAAVGDVTENAYNYAIVMAKGTSIDDRVKVALPDGTTGTYNLNDSGNAVSLSNVNVGQVYGYNITSSGSIRLTAVAAANTHTATASITFTKGRTTVAGTGMTTQYANSNTVFYYSDPVVGSGSSASIDTVNTYTGYTNAPTLAANAASNAVVYRSGTRVVAVVFTGTSLTTTDVTDNLYISSVGNSTSSYTNATAFINGSSEPTAIRVDGSVSNRTAYTYSINSDGYYELDTVPTGNLFTGASVYASNSNTVIVTHNSTNTELGITANTLVVNHSTYLSDPIAELGGIPEEGDNLSYVVYSKDSNGQPDDALLIVIRNTSNSSAVTAETTLQVDTANNRVLAFNPNGETPTAIMNAAADALVAAGYTNVTVGAASAAAVGSNYGTISATLNGSNRTMAITRSARLDVNGTTVGYTHSGNTALTGLTAGAPVIVVKANETTASAAGFSAASPEFTASATGTGTYIYTAGDADDKDVISLVRGTQVTVSSGTVTVGGTSFTSGHYVATGTDLTVTATAGNTVYATADGKTTAVVSGANSSVYTLGNDAVTFSMSATPASGLNVTMGATASNGTYANGVYTAKNGIDRFNVAISKTTNLVQGEEITITVSPVAGLYENVTLTLADDSATLSGNANRVFTAGEDSTAVRTYTVTMGSSNAALTLGDNTTATYALTLPAGVTPSSGAFQLGDGTYVAHAGSVTLTGLPTNHYLKADNDYVIASSATFTMPGNDLEITADKYHKITGVDVDSSGSGVSTNLGSVTVEAPSDLDNTYVKEGTSVTVTFTLGGTGTVVNNAIAIVMDGLTGLTSSKYTTAAELLAVDDTHETDISEKADTVAVGEISTADFAIAYTLSTT